MTAGISTAGHPVLTLLTGAIQAALLCGMVDGIRAYRLP